MIARLTVRWNVAQQRDAREVSPEVCIQEMKSLLTRRRIPRVSGTPEYHEEKVRTGELMRDWPPEEGYGGDAADVARRRMRA